MGSKNELSTLKRGLEALAFMNEQGATNIADLARHLQVPRANAFRVLNTLVVAGYCSRHPDSRLYTVTPLVHSLAVGANPEEILTHVARGPVFRLGAEIGWPVALTTPRRDRMLIRLVTDHASPLALNRSRPGREVPMIETASGLLYLALTTEEIRSGIMDIIRDKMGAASLRAHHFEIRKVFAAARRDGFVFLPSVDDKRTSAAVPLRFQGNIIGCLSMRYITSALSQRAVIERYLHKIRKTAAGIESRLQERTTEVHKPPRTRPTPGNRWR
ncbi:MAG: helix-turn-helix domain-containing protein [Rhodospirillaceae bacterium]|nr:helix-turn-helix domain-containing protein [Rhodospirillaceae bacterium]